jgi:hypothetical protein
LRHRSWYGPSRSSRVWSRSCCKLQGCRYAARTTRSMARSDLARRAMDVVTEYFSSDLVVCAGRRVFDAGVGLCEALGLGVGDLTAVAHRDR